MHWVTPEHSRNTDCVTTFGPLASLQLLLKLPWKCDSYYSSCLYLFRAMAPQTKQTCRMALSSLAEPPRQAPRQQQANLRTLEVTIDNVVLDGAKGQAYNALRAVVADGNSVAAGSPQQYHGLNTFSPRAFAQMTLPPASAQPGVLEAVMGLRPPTATNNPYQHISWTFMMVDYGMNQAASQRAADFIAKKTVTVLTQAVVIVDVNVPAENAKQPWSATSTIEGNRLKMVRKGAGGVAGQYEIIELFNLKLRLSTKLSPSVRKVFKAVQKAFASKYSAVVSVADVLPGSEYPQQNTLLQSSSAKLNAKESAKVKKVPASKTSMPKKGKVKKAAVKKTGTKKPAPFGDKRTDAPFGDKRVCIYIYIERD